MACFVFSRLSAAFLLFSVSSVLLLCRCFFVSFPLPFFFLSFFSLHVSVSSPSCAISSVSLFLVSDTRVLNVPRPGCRTCRDPDVEHAETRVSYMSRPGCHTMPFRISVFSFSLPLFSFARMRIYYNVFLFSSLSPLCLYSRKICSSTHLSISVL